MKSERGFGRKMLGAMGAAVVLGALASAQGLVRPGSSAKSQAPAAGSLANDMRYTPVRKPGLAGAIAVEPLKREITVSLDNGKLIVAGGSIGELAVIDIGLTLEADPAGFASSDGAVLRGNFAADGSYVAELSAAFPQLQVKRLHARPAKIDGRMVTLVVDLEVEAAPFATWTALGRLDNPERAGGKIPVTLPLHRPGKSKPR